jgi:hypothetical protein
LESEWNEYIEENESMYFSDKGSRKKKSNNGTNPQEMPTLPSMVVSEIMLVDDEDYEPDCPWKMFDNNDDDRPQQSLNRVSYGNNDSDSDGFEGV